MTDLCRWCGQQIAQDGHGHWVHTGLSYGCRDRFNVLLPTSAALMPGARWTSLYRSSRSLG